MTHLSQDSYPSCPHQKSQKMYFWLMWMKDNNSQNALCKFFASSEDFFPDKKYINLSPQGDMRVESAVILIPHFLQIQSLMLNY